MPSIAVLLPLALQLLSTSAALASPTPVAPKQSPEVVSKSAAAAASKETPGFVNNGTIGSYACLYNSQTEDSQLILGAESTVPGSQCPEALPAVYPNNRIELRAPDDSIRATFQPYGSGVTELWVKDRWGGWRDIVLGYDNTTNWATDPIHPNFGPIVGRYANRIKNGTFELNGHTYRVPKNENGLDSLHGGDIGYDRSNYTIAHLSANELVLEHMDPDGFQGFPGQVKTTTRYRLGKNATWHIELNATATKETPILLTSHVYWNLDAFNETASALDYVLHMPYADKYVKTDSILIPTGPLPSVKVTPFNFQTPTPFSRNFNNTMGVCGYDCQGWDSCFVMSDPPGYHKDKPALEMYSLKSGIKLSVATNQPAVQVYTCDGIDNPSKGSIPRKQVHGGKVGEEIGEVVYGNHECVVLEMEDYIDGINNPQWGRNQIYGPDRPYHWKSTYTFTTVDESGKPM
ncbi:related to Aldose 1-epimerase precursor [Sporisorium scitamineum]|uniref:Related to Aldose 1-epimerase n=2 Tax=Sporisorium scitamineum TaxID=49012 RepID=A0A127Z894_9BASI|nr:related to Aldose 1-epimerase precursor [Sporisorium scitamineum]